MGIQDNIEKLKGKAKEAMGERTGNEDLRAEGQADQASGATKEKVDNAGDRVNDTVDSAKDKFNKR